MSTVTMDVTEYDELRKCKAEMPFDAKELETLRNIQEQLKVGKTIIITNYDTNYSFMRSHEAYTFFNVPEFFDKLQIIISEKYSNEYEKKLLDEIKKLKRMSLKEFKVWKDL